MNPHEWTELGEVDGVRVSQHVETGHLSLIARGDTGSAGMFVTADTVVRLAQLAVGHPRFDEQLAIAHVRSNPRLWLYRVHHGYLWTRKDRIA